MNLNPFAPPKSSTENKTENDLPFVQQFGCWALAIWASIAELLFVFFAFYFWGMINAIIVLVLGPIAVLLLIQAYSYYFPYKTPESRRKYLRDKRNRLRSKSNKS